MRADFDEENTKQRSEANESKVEENAMPYVAEDNPRVESKLRDFHLHHCLRVQARLGTLMQVPKLD